MKKILSAAAGATLVGLIMLLFAVGSSPSRADHDPTFGHDRAPGVILQLNCTAGTGYVEIRNQDMGGSTVEVTLDGVRQPDLQVDSSGELTHWYSITPGQAHSAAIIYDFVPGNPDEENVPMGASCLPAGGAEPTTAPSTAPPTTAPATAPTTAPAEPPCTCPPVTTPPTTAPPRDPCLPTTT